MSGSRSSDVYRRPGHPFDGVPRTLADLAFNTNSYGVGVGNGQYGGPAAVATTGYGGWAFTDLTAAGGVALDNTGRLVITTATTADSGTQIQKTDTPFRYTATNRTRCFARIATGTAITTDAFFGLCNIDTTIIAAAGTEAVTDCIGFFKGATATDWSFLVQKSSTTTTTALGLTLTDAAFAIIGFDINAATCRVYGVLDPNDGFATTPGLLGAGTAVSLANVPDTTNQVLSIAAGQEGGTTARTVTVDWGFVHQTHA